MEDKDSRPYSNLLQRIMSSTSQDKPVRTEKDLHLNQLSTSHLNVLNLNLGSLARLPRVQDKAIKISHSVILGIIRNNPSHVLCFQEAGGIEDNEDVREAVLTARYTGIMVSQAGAKPIACFVKGDSSTRVDLVHRMASEKGPTWQFTGAYFRVWFGTVTPDSKIFTDDVPAPFPDVYCSTGHEYSERQGKGITPSMSVTGYGEGNRILSVAASTTEAKTEPIEPLRDDNSYPSTMVH